MLCKKVYPSATNTPFAESTKKYTSTAKQCLICLGEQRCTLLSCPHCVALFCAECYQKDRQRCQQNGVNFRCAYCQGPLSSYYIEPQPLVEKEYFLQLKKHCVCIDREANICEDLLHGNAECPFVSCPVCGLDLCQLCYFVCAGKTCPQDGCRGQLRIRHGSCCILL